MTRRGWGDQRGFTLAEISVVCAIGLFFIASFLTISTAMQKQMTQQSVYFNTNRAARQTVDRIARDIREAIAVVSTHGGYTTGNSTLVLQVPSIDGAGSATDIETQFDYVTYRFDSTNSRILREVDVLGSTSQREGGADQVASVVANNVQSLAFARDNGTAMGSVAATFLPYLHHVNVRVQAQGTTLNNTQSSEADADVYLRNNDN